MFKWDTCSGLLHPLLDTHRRIPLAEYRGADPNMVARSLGGARSELTANVPLPANVTNVEHLDKHDLDKPWDPSLKMSFGIKLIASISASTGSTACNATMP